MNGDDRVSVLFVTNENYMEPTGGGVQLCSREYLRTLEGCGFEIHQIAYSIDRSLRARLRRKLQPHPFGSIHPAGLVQRIVEKAEQTKARWVFLNNAEANALAPKIRSRAPELKLIFLSHGVELTDEVNALRLDPASLPRHRHRPSWFGKLLFAELQQRAAIDGTVCISTEDVIFEKWLGCPSVLFIPRSISHHPLEFSPMLGRVGTVSTLNHVPNLDGIRQFATALRGTEVTLRLVGGPEKIGCQLQLDFPNIVYCGKLSDEGLRQEAATWCAFVNPVFCQARGASTKVATALGWGLPVLTTMQGSRGYLWNSELLPLAKSPRELAEACKAVALDKRSEEWRLRASSIVDLAPNTVEASALLYEFLVTLG